MSGLIEERLGLSYVIADKTLLEHKIAARVLELGFDSALDYYYHLRYDDSTGAELNALAETLVVNETYFFREHDQIHAVLSTFVVPLIERGLRPRIWCAACSTGEEPLTLAMLLEGRGISDQVSLVASDISERALRHARAGVYGRRSLRALPVGVMDRWLLPHGDGARVVPRILNSVTWSCVNLLDKAGVAALGRFDFILCRNVLIYFKDETIVSVVSNLRNALRAGGALFVGTSESLLRFDCSLVCEEQRGVFFYRNDKK
jgi:chemotaxis protein methyltransferase CheR